MLPPFVCNVRQQKSVWTGKQLPTFSTLDQFLLENIKKLIIFGV
jgi:hypothetical protein